MLGKVRACSLSSLETLELERTCSKLIKDDSLSIYETTLMKLKEGSRRNISLTPEEYTKTDVIHAMVTTLSNKALMTVDAMTVDAPPGYPSSDTSSGSSDCLSMNSSRAHQNQNGNLSVLYMFSKYKSSRNETLDSRDEKAMAIEISCSSESTSPSHSN